MLWFEFLSVVVVSPFCFITSYHCFSFLKKNWNSWWFPTKAAYWVFFFCHVNGHYFM
jgi:hypothetical protein